MERLGKYELLRLLGQGGMGAVYKGRDTVIGRDVAIKVIHERALSDPVTKKRFYREARSAGRLSHPNITTLYDVGEEDGTPFLVMEYLEGDDLRHRLDTEAQLPLTNRLAIAAQICQGLHYAHEQGVIHRDVKPGNIRVLPSGRVKIMDFGIARIQNETQGLTQTNLSLGTPQYMSPEQIKGEGQLDQRTDIFSFGVLFYELLTGTNPFAGERITTVIYKILNTEPEPLTIAPEALSHDLRQIVSTCLAKDRQDRYPDFAAVLHDLAPLATRDAEPITPASPSAPPSPLLPPLGTTLTSPLQNLDQTVPLPATVDEDATVALPRVPDEAGAPSTDDTVALTPVSVPSPHPPEPPRPAVDHAPDRVPTPSPSSSRKGLVVTVGVLLFLLLIGGGYFLRFGGDPDGGGGSQAPPLQASATPSEQQETSTSTVGRAAPGETAAPLVAETPPAPREAREPLPEQEEQASQTEPNATASRGTPPPAEANTPATSDETPASSTLETEGVDNETGPVIEDIQATPGGERSDTAGRTPEGESDLPPEVLQALEPTVQLLARDLKNNLENKDSGGMRAMMYRTWDAFFQNAKAITATVRPERVQVSGTRATVSVQVALTYQDENGRDQQKNALHTWTLQHMNDDWMLLRVSGDP